MKAINQAVYDFMDERMGIYVNPYKVEIVLEEQDCIGASCDWPGESDDDYYYLELVFDSDTIDTFTTVFGIKLINQIDAIQPALLLELYRQGKTVIHSAIDHPPIYYLLQFRKQHNIISVTGSEEEKSEEVHEPLETPKEYMAYTLQHFQLTGKS